MGQYVEVEHYFVEDYKPRQCYGNSFKAILEGYDVEKYVVGYLHFESKYPNVLTEKSPVPHAWNRLISGEYVDLTPLSPFCIYKYEMVAELSKAELDKVHTNKYQISIDDILKKKMLFTPITLFDFIEK